MASKQAASWDFIIQWCTSRAGLAQVVHKKFGDAASWIAYFAKLKLIETLQEGVQACEACSNTTKPAALGEGVNGKKVCCVQNSDCKASGLQRAGTRQVAARSVNSSMFLKTTSFEDNCRAKTLARHSATQYARKLSG